MTQVSSCFLLLCVNVLLPKTHSRPHSKPAAYWTTTTVCVLDCVCVLHAGSSSGCEETTFTAIVFCYNSQKHPMRKSWQSSDGFPVTFWPGVRVSWSVLKLNFIGWLSVWFMILSNRDRTMDHMFLTWSYCINSALLTVQCTMYPIVTFFLIMCNCTLSAI